MIDKKHRKKKIKRKEVIEYSLAGCSDRECLVKEPVQQYEDDVKEVYVFRASSRPSVHGRLKRKCTQQRRDKQIPPKNRRLDAKD